MQEPKTESIKYGCGCVLHTEDELAKRQARQKWFEALCKQHGIAMDDWPALSRILLPLRGPGKASTLRVFVDNL